MNGLRWRSFAVHVVSMQTELGLHNKTYATHWKVCYLATAGGLLNVIFLNHSIKGTIVESRLYRINIPIRSLRLFVSRDCTQLA